MALSLKEKSTGPRVEVLREATVEWVEWIEWAQDPTDL